MRYIDCRKYAQEILDRVKEAPNKRKLAIITVGEDEASKSYVKGKIRDCEYCGIPVSHIQIKDSEVAAGRLVQTILNLNTDCSVAGIILQLPLPESLGYSKQYTDLIAPHKDVDGFRYNSPFKPCTPKGIVHLMKQELGDLTGLNVLIIGRSNLVGKPLARMLTDEDCTVTLAHSKTKSIYAYMSEADVVISAIGKPKHIDVSVCWNTELLIDVGINRDENGKLCGDFDTDSYEGLVNKVTPVPGGVGLLTRAMLMQNVLEASEGRFYE